MAWTPDTEAEWRARYNATQAALRKFGGPLTDSRGMDAPEYAEADYESRRYRWNDIWWKE